MKIGVFSISSIIREGNDIEETSNSFLTSIQNRVDYDMEWCGTDYSRYGNFALNIIYIETGGTEALFRKTFFPFKGPFYFLTSGTNNSLPASIEILSFLRKENIEAEILHGNIDYISERINAIIKVRSAFRKLDGKNYGLVGKPCDWLISSSYNTSEFKKKLGVNIIEIPMEEFTAEINSAIYPTEIRDTIKLDFEEDQLTASLNVYGALRRLIDKYELSGLSLRCYDLIDNLKKTSCLAVAILNRDGIIAGCEGDVPAMISMAILNALTGKPVFQANPANINVRNNEVIFAHCTVPLNMVKDYKYESHFESGIGLSVRGVVPRGESTIFKVSGELDEYFVSNSDIINNPGSPFLCRTQITIKPEKSVDYFLKNTIGNHHLIVNGHYENIVNEFFATLNRVES